jgi:acyl-ACP thioesterase
MTLDGVPSVELVAGLSVPYRVRFDECTPAGTVRTSTLLRYAQDVAWVHSDRLGFGRAWYAERGLAWLVRSVELAILRPIRLGDEVAVTTAVTGFRKVWARRRSEMSAPDGAMVAWVHTDWVMSDARGLPTRVPAEFPAAFGVPPGGFDPVKVALPAPPSGAAGPSFPVRLHELDPMAHVNNAVYLDYLEESVARRSGAAALAAVPRRYRLEYLLPAAPGAMLAAAAWPLAAGSDPGPAEADAAAGLSRGRADGGMAAPAGAWAHVLTDADGRELARGRLDPGR